MSLPGSCRQQRVFLVIWSQPQAQHLLVLVQLPGDSEATCTLGACAVDAASGHLLIGQ